MKSVKKMLSLLLVAMLLVTAIPFAASADTEDTYHVFFAAQKGSEAKYSNEICGVTVLSSFDNYAIEEAAKTALANAGISSITSDLIVSRVSAVGDNGNFLNNVVYGDIIPVVDRDAKQVRYVLIVTDRVEPEITYPSVKAVIWLDSENTGVFVDSGKKVDVVLKKTTVGGDVTYTLRDNGGASNTTIQSILGAEYKNKTISVRMSGPSSDGKVDYYVTVLGTSTSTGTNVPNYDGTNTNNGGIIIGPGNGSNNNNTNNGSNNNNGTIGSGGSAGNGTTGSNNGTTGGTNGTTGTTNPPSYSEVPGNVYLEIYTNKNFGSYDARFSITNNSNKNYNIGTDGTVSAERGGDLWNLMASIYTAKDSNGMEVKLYQFEGNNFPVDWAFGNYYTSISNLTAARQNKDITIRVVVNNVYRKTADTSNPKTGDPIMMSVAVLGITACGLAAAFLYSKKRKTV